MSGDSNLFDRGSFTAREADESLAEFVDRQVCLWISELEYHFALVAMAMEAT